MSKKDIDSKVSTWWPVIAAAALTVFAYGALHQRVAANEDDIKTLKTDHDTLIEVRQVVCSLADVMKAPIRCREN